MSSVSHSRTVGRILLEIPKHERSKLLEPLTEYVQWLLKQRGDRETLDRFNSELAAIDQEISKKVQADQITVEEGRREKAEWVRWTALDESRDAALFIAFKIVLERDILVALKEQLRNDTRQLDEISREVEQRLVAKLEEILAPAPVRS